jgi:hypothetical protein
MAFLRAFSVSDFVDTLISLLAALAPKSGVRLGSDIKARIGQQLHAMYSDVVNQGIPDRFSEILRRLCHQRLEFHPKPPV